MIVSILVIIVILLVAVIVGLLLYSNSLVSHNDQLINIGKYIYDFKEDYIEDILIFKIKINKLTEKLDQLKEKDDIKETIINEILVNVRTLRLKPNEQSDDKRYY